MSGVSKETSFKFLMNNLAIRPGKLEEYNLITSYLKTNNIQFYSYNPSPVKPIKAIIKYLPNDLDCDDILSDLVYKGIPALKVTHLIGRDKTKTNMYIVSVGKSFAEKLYSIKNTIGFAVKIEALRPKNAITQCHRCQRLGHASLHCGMQARCVKCGEGHLTTECTITKSSTSKCKCVNCGMDHPASYKGCPHYKEAMAARQRARSTRPVPQATTTTKPTPPALNANNFPTLKTTQAQKLQATSAWVRSSQPPAKSQPKPTPTETPLGGMAEMFTFIKEFAPLLKEIVETLKTINIKETLQNIKDLLQTVSCMFGNGK